MFETLVIKFLITIGVYYIMMILKSLDLEQNTHSHHFFVGNFLIS